MSSRRDNQSGDNGPREQQRDVIIAGMTEIGPRDTLESMIASQLLACHDAAMDCYAYALNNHPQSSLRRERLNQAGKLSRTFAMLLDTLDRQRGKGMQKITVEHVHVHSGGGQAVFGEVRAKSENQGHARDVTHAPQPAMRRAGAGADRRRCRMAAAGCTAGSRREHRRVTGMPSNMASTRPKRSQTGARLGRCCGR
jgi:hypothetical protein